jgi:hypothetical protein
MRSNFSGRESWIDAGVREPSGADRFLPLKPAPRDHEAEPQRLIAIPGIFPAGDREPANSLDRPAIVC